MLFIKFDKNRDKSDGQYFIKLVDYNGKDKHCCNTTGYWCDVEHLKAIKKELDLILFRRIL